jgi:hypothetical protein
MWKRMLVLAVLAGIAAGCIVRTGRPCRTDCWWEHGRKVCDRRCR